MSAFSDKKLSSADPEADLDWTVDIDRISRRAREAFLTETPDPWTRIEAECVVQLIDAELIAMANRLGRGERVETSVRHLKALRTETMLAIKTLDAVLRHSAAASTATEAAAQADRQELTTGDVLSLPPDGAMAKPLPTGTGERTVASSAVPA